MAHTITDPKKLNTQKDFEDYLKAQGYSQTPNGSSHEVWRKPGAQTISLAGHKGVISPGVKRNVLKLLMGDSYYQKS